ncbi:hypothetical protein CC2G_002491 [Coprinopsis cinerea AmutBmut pab1-1]|nr:hypothetical protein CC2G_002491 [Coprinopsis cinerea AmutBmut pab1-1]
MSATNKTTVTRFENSGLLELLNKPSLHVLQYGSIYLGMRRIEPRLGTWALVLRQPNSPSSLIFYISATACTPVGGAADQPPRYMYSLKSKGAILSKLAVVDEAGNVEKEIIDPAVLELAPHLSPIRSVCVTYFEFVLIRNRSGLSASAGLSKRSLRCKVRGSPRLL